MEESKINRMISEANGFCYIYEKLNQILIDNFFDGKRNDRECDLINPAIVNGNFACELYLKATLEKTNIKIPITHKLDSLFSTLNKEYQIKIIEMFKERGYTRDIFLEKIKYISNGFVIARYDYENNKTYYLLSGFLHCFLKILKEVS